MSLKYEIDADKIENDTEITTAVSMISYQVENANNNNLSNNEINRQVSALSDWRKFPQNLEYVDSYSDPITGTTAAAFLNNDTGKVIVGMTGTNVHKEKMG